MKDKVIIANASGFWGDEAAAVVRQVRGGPIDYLTMDYLAEITMIILARQKAQNENLGYARDFIDHCASVLDEVAARGITVIANAGGINPGACARALEGLIEQRGLDLPVAVVDGDDLMPELSDLVAAGVDFRHLDTGEPLGELVGRVNAANAYVGARPIVRALQQGARIVVTGRTYDAASVVAPIVHELGWDWQDWDRLAAALLAGHLIECGSQVTGGNYTLWREVPSFDDMGYPLVEVSADGSFVLTKHPRTGGLVSVRTATEQILYEIGDPRAYCSPDVVADFTSFRLDQDGKDRVRVSGVRGMPPTSFLKVSMTYEAGAKVTCSVVVSGPDAAAKAEKLAQIFWSRVATDELLERRTELLGHSGCWGASGAPACEPNEILLRLGARAADPAPLQQMAKALAGIALAGPPGICGAGGRPQVSPAYGYWPALIAREHVTARCFFAGRSERLPCNEGPSAALDVPDEPVMPPSSTPDRPRVRVPLARVAFARSGDKGDTCNVGVAALKPELYAELLREVTAERVAAYFASTVRGRVTRHRLDNLHAMNFVMRRALDGGGTVSLQLDAQGKTVSQGLLNMPVEIDRALLEAAGALP